MHRMWAAVICAGLGLSLTAEEQGAEADYDPLRGMREDGGIPPTDVPEVAHPERWRYVPPGRIPPGNIFQRFFITSFIVPKFEYEEATGMDLGVGIFDTDFRHQRRQEFAGMSASRSTEGQEQYSVVWTRRLAHSDLVNGGAYFEERSSVRLAAAYDKVLTARYFGNGIDSRESDETSYTNEATIVGASFQHGIPHPGDEFMGRVGIRYEHHNLNSGEADDIPSTDAVYTREFTEGDGHDSLWLSLGIQYDRRDSSAQPYRGWNIDLTIDTAVAQTRFDPAVIGTLSGSWALPIPSPWHSGGTGNETNPPTDTIAVGGFVAATGGDLPFYLQPRLGGPRTLRGYIRDRFVDQNVWHVSAEWRTWFVPRGIAFTDAVRIERVGLALFVDAGSASRHASELFSEQVQWSYGLGVRWAFERTAVFRTDYALSEEGGQFIASFGLSF